MPNFLTAVELFFLQVLIVYFLTNYFNVVILFYNLIYFFLVIVMIILYLFILQIDLFGLFLLMTELVIVFVTLLLIFNLSSQGEKTTDVKNKFETIWLLFGFIFFSGVYIHTYEPEFYLPSLFLDSQIWDNYYEALNNILNNDLFSVFSVLYYNYSLFLILIGFFLLIGSLICVNLNKIFLKTNTKNYANIFDAYEFLSNVSDSVFLRKQNLNNQTTHETSTKEFKKK